MTEKNQPVETTEQNTEGLTVKIGKTTFVVNVKQSETAKKPIESVLRSLCIRETMECVLPQSDGKIKDLEELPKTS